ncbi:hypothetical protein KF707_22300 [Candidatus Obscuribacterales bacterium]|nr:hypothetical protein [Candidatus Obscuribacterales bacterium]MBX3138975.1 hypothetical protein [Candidatus Obscuribacterales bacterium]MBX3149651.1 hypothetical protein [Candidatus Obscuribacterales bacterium]
MYEKLNILAKSLVAKFAPQPDELDDPGTLSRLKQVTDRHERKSESETLESDGYFAGRVAHRASENLDVDEAKGYWRIDSGRHQRLSARSGEQLKGAKQTFEIDPIKNMPE